MLLLAIFLVLFFTVVPLFFTTFFQANATFSDMDHSKSNLMTVVRRHRVSLTSGTSGSYKPS